MSSRQMTAQPVAPSDQRPATATSAREPSDARDVRHVLDLGAIETARAAGTTYFTRCGIERDPAGRTVIGRVERISDLTPDICPICSEITATGWHPGAPR